MRCYLPHIVLPLAESIVSSAVVQAVRQWILHAGAADGLLAASACGWSSMQGWPGLEGVICMMSIPRWAAEHPTKSCVWACGIIRGMITKSCVWACMWHH